MIPYTFFLHGHNLLHLDNPIPIRLNGKDIQTKPIPKNLNIQPDWTPKSGSCTPLALTHCHSRHGFVLSHP